MDAEPTGVRAVLLLGATRARRREAESLSRALEDVLPEGWHVHAAGPFDLPSALDRIASGPLDELVVVPVHPHHGLGASPSAVRELYRLLSERAFDVPLAVRTTWYDDAGYLNALARWVAEHAAPPAANGDPVLLRFVSPFPSECSSREPYLEQLRRTVEGVAELLDWPPDRVRLDLEHPDASPSGAPRTLLCPLPFPSDPHDPATGGDACSPLLSYAPFLAALRGVVLHGSQQAPRRRGSLRPLLERGSRVRPRPEEPATLLLVGAAVAGPLAGGQGPSFRFSDVAAFGRVKPSHKSLRGFLDGVRADGRVLEALVWNTCQRVECYAWIPDATAREERERLVAHLRRGLFGSEPRGLAVNVLVGAEAWHHLLRTACGLNSDLPGDLDVTTQLETALRSACSAHTAGPRSEGLVAHATDLAHELRRDTSWGVLGTGYCAAALARVFEADRIEADELRHVVIGGSTTSRSILRALREEHAVPEAGLTVVYRDHHGQMKELRTAVGNGRRLRVHAYVDDRVLSAIARADLVYFGIDQHEPVLDASTLAGLRSFTERPLTILDFNSFGSVRGSALRLGMTLWNARSLDRAVATHTAILTARGDFSRALAEAEERIADRVSAAASARLRC